MSADFINGLGPRAAGMREAYGLGARPPVAGPAPTGSAADAPTASPSSAPEGFAPTAEAGESKQDTRAGEARASEIFSAWAPASAPPSPSAGVLDIQGAENTSVNQVHGATGSPAPEAGFTGATVFSSKPPQS